MEELLSHIYDHGEPGAILVFLPGGISRQNSTALSVNSLAQYGRQEDGEEVLFARNGGMLQEGRTCRWWQMLFPRT